MKSQQSAQTNTGARAQSVALAFVVPMLVIIVLDRITKTLVDSAGYAVNQLIAGPFLGLLQIRLVHNQGAAWGIFSDSTFVLGLFSFVLSAAIVLFVVFFKKELTLVQVAFLGMVVAGGIGNGFDRLVYGYVVDFIETAFMDFPVFNIADIGITCGIFIFALLYCLQEFKKDGNK